MINRLTQWRAREDEEDLQTPKPRCMGQAKTLSAWHRLALKIVTLIIHSTRQSAMDYLLNKSKTPVAKAKSTSTPKKETKTKQVGDGKVRRGLGQELPRSKANKTWAQEPTTCAHDEDKLRMRAGRGQHWWTCLDCGARWQRLEWEMDKALNTGASSSQDAPTPVEQEIVSYAKNPPRTLPGPRHRPEVPALTLEPVPDTEEEQMTADQRLEALLRQSAKTQGRVFPRSPSSEKRKSETSCVRPIQDRARPRTPRLNDRVEVHEIFSSGEDLSQEGTFSVVSP